MSNFNQLNGRKQISRFSTHPARHKFPQFFFNPGGNLNSESMFLITQNIQAYSVNQNQMVNAGSADG